MSARPVTAAFLVALGLGLISGCGSGAKSGSATTTSGPSGQQPTSSDATPTTTASTAPAVPTTAAPPAGPSKFFPDRDAAIDYLVNAWKIGIKYVAIQGADAKAVDNLFTQPAAGFTLYGCDEGNFDTSTCNFRNRSTNGYAQITAQKMPQGWIVTSVYMSTDG